MTSQELRSKYLEFFKSKGHAIIPSAPIVPENDASTLFISAGMQPLIPYLLGQEHPAGTKLVDCQKCIRTGDIDEVGDTHHHTFFEMLGNWSLGDYFKEQSIQWSYEFLKDWLNIDMDRIWVSVFAGDDDAPRDEEAAKIWQKAGIPEDRIMYLGKEDNWWAAGPTGPCGPDTEIFYLTDDGEKREIWNNVFMVYNRQDDGSLKELPKKNVDTGMGLERTLATLNSISDNYLTDLFQPLVKEIESITNADYSNQALPIRVIADHMRAAVFLIDAGIEPSNKGQGYVLRRLLRRAAVKAYGLKVNFNTQEFEQVARKVFDCYPADYFATSQQQIITSIITEITRFQQTLAKGLKEVEKLSEIDGKTAFDLYQTYGFPLELTQELAQEKGQQINKEQFQAEFEKHKELSRTASAGMFKGGLAHHSDTTTKYHTATHLLHKALRQILGDHVQQKGSNITDERMRFDFSHSDKLTEEQLKQVEDLVNQKIEEDLPVTVETMSKEDALNSGAMAFFAEKYGDQVTVYSVGDFSKEICGGPHVEHTGQIGQFTITKEESAGAGIRRIYATVL